MAQRFIEIADITKRFGAVSLGTPQIINTIGATDIYVPTAGKAIRLKWFAMATPDTNTGTVIVTLSLAGKNLYIWPMGNPGAFSHSSVREGTVDGKLTISLSDAQYVYINMDLEEI